MCLLISVRKIGSLIQASRAIRNCIAELTCLVIIVRKFCFSKQGEYSNQEFVLWGKYVLGKKVVSWLAMVFSEFWNNDIICPFRSQLFLTTMGERFSFQIKQNYCMDWNTRSAVRAWDTSVLLLENIFLFMSRVLVPQIAYLFCSTVHLKLLYCSETAIVHFLCCWKMITGFCKSTGSGLGFMQSSSLSPETNKAVL